MLLIAGVKRRLGVSAVVLAVLCVLGAGTLGFGVYALYDQYRSTHLPMCPEPQAPPGAPGPRELTGVEHALVEEVVRADAKIQRIAGGQQLTVRTMPEYRTETGENDGAAEVSWPAPTTAPASEFGTGETTEGRYTNVRSIIVSVDLETRAVRGVIPGLEARSEGVPFKRASCRSDH